MKDIVLVNGDEHNTLEPLNEFMIELYSLVDPLLVIRYLHPDERMRTAADSGLMEISGVLSELLDNQDIYHALSNISTEQLSQDANRYRQLMIREYEERGIQYSESLQRRLAVLNNGIVRSEREYDQAISDDDRYIVRTVEEVPDLPTDFIQSHIDENGLVRISADYPDYPIVMKYSHDETLRKALYMQHQSIGYPDNHQNLASLLDQRYDYAKALGYRNWTTYRANGSMAGDAQTIISFIDETVDSVRPRVDYEINQILQRKQQDDPDAEEAKHWDVSYYLNLLNSERIGIGQSSLREYLEYSRVVAETISIIEEMFDLEIILNDTVKTWHPDVETYDVYDDGSLIGRFYLDLFYRDDKLAGSHMIRASMGIADHQLPSAVIATDFSDAVNESGKILLEKRSVNALFHEFGHTLHHIFSGTQSWFLLSAAGVPRDFSEVPSLLLEQIGRSDEVLQRLTRHYQTGETLELRSGTDDGESLGSGLSLMNLAYISALSHIYHVKPTPESELKNVLARITNEYSPFQYHEATYGYANLPSLTNLDCQVYTYLWSGAIVVDLLSEFDDSYICSPEVARRVRQYLLEPGASKDPDELVRDFLGRDYSFDRHYEALLSYHTIDSAAAPQAPQPDPIPPDPIPQDEPDYEWPSETRLCALGGYSYAQWSMLSEIFSEATNTDVEVFLKTYTGNMLDLFSYRQSEFAVNDPNILIQIFDGYGERTGPYPGFWDVRIVWPNRVHFEGYIVNYESEINTVYDIKPGIRFADYDGNTRFNSGLLNWVGLGEDEVTWVPCDTYQAALKSVAAGESDITYASLTQLDGIQSDYSTVRLLELPAREDPTGAQRLLDQAGAYNFVPAYGVEFPGSDDITTLANIDVLTAFVDEDAELIFHFVQWLDENYGAFPQNSEYRGEHSYDTDMTLENLLLLADTSYLPLHEGVVAYLELKGLWTLGREQRQQYNVQIMKSYARDYRDAMFYAQVRGIYIHRDNPAWIEHWNQQRAEAGLEPVTYRAPTYSGTK
jgi:thimet oligopeptidase